MIIALAWIGFFVVVYLLALGLKSLWDRRKPRD